MPARKRNVGHALSLPRGFTLIELMIAVTILAILAIAGLTVYSGAQAKGRDGKKKQDLRALQVAVELFYQKNQAIPTAAEFNAMSTTARGGPFINEMPTAPAGGTYLYLPNGSTDFTLCVALEESGAGASAPPAGCPANSYVIKYP